MMPTSTDLARRTRRLRNVAEPIAASVFFAPEAHAAYAELGFPNPGGEEFGIAKFDWDVYFVSRAACMGQVHGDVAAAVFGVFPHPLVSNAIAHGWTLTNPTDILAARQRGAIAALERLLGGVPEGTDRAVALLKRGLDAAHTSGKPVFSGLRTIGWTGTPLGDLWRACDMYREHRGDAHVMAWAAHGLNGCEACILNDLRQGLDLGSYVRTRGWTAEEVGAAIDALRARGWVVGNALSEAGREGREVIEVATDIQQVSIVNAIGDDFNELVERLTPWRDAIVAGRGYPGRGYIEQAGKRVQHT
ncbi:MAG: hypothetical protein ETSY1_41695 [Candidatus Entotheonella factor]|uniref:SalK n=1 Tax=Entotheonella factor TaxID=1429438 RepID=W4L6D2_ENTF1|nr:MAG: hypothetical protein ETSY1_41695 [Candidatus Entotheonella factor]